MANKTVKPSSSLHRWNSKSTTAQTTTMSFVDRTNTQRTQGSTTTAATATSSFLPELNSTPPMPTFQKPDMATPTPVRKVKEGGDDENATPTRGGYIPRRPLDCVELSTVSDPGGLAEHTTANTSAIQQPSTTNTRAPMSLRFKSRATATTALKDRIGDTPPLPAAWTHRHDKALCVLDARLYSTEAMVIKMKRTYPELQGVLIASMFEKRLRQLDQDIEVSYWREAIEAMDQEREVRSPGLPAGIQSALSTNTVNLTGGASETMSSRDGGSSPSMSTMARSQSTGNLDDAATLHGRASTATTRPTMVTSGFLTGYRSHIP